MRLLYQTCMDTETVEERSLQDLEQIISRELGGWPVVDGDQWRGDFSWEELSIQAARQGFDSDTILTCGIHQRRENSSSIYFFRDCH